MKKWITFDLDGTLMQNPFVSHVFPEIEEKISLQNKELQKATLAFVDEHKNRMSQKLYAEAYDWDDIVSLYLQSNNLHEPINVEEILLKHCTAPKVYLLEESIPEVLRELKNRGYSLAVVTNGFARYQLPVMEALNLADLFDVIITPEEARFAKPDKAIYESLLQSGVIAGHVGDRIDHDVISANELRVPSIWINRRLPESIQNLPLDSRNASGGLPEIIMEKFTQETDITLKELPKNAIPEKVICSIDELLSIF